MKLSVTQRELLQRLPDLPNEGVRLTGDLRRTATSLVRLGLAQALEEGTLAVYFVRTGEGKNALERS